MHRCQPSVAKGILAAELDQASPICMEGDGNVADRDLPVGVACQQDSNGRRAVHHRGIRLRRGLRQ